MQLETRIVVAGRVQGVFFRAKAKNIADSLGLNGYARNLPSGEVEIIISGKVPEEFFTLLKKRTGSERVDSINTSTRKQRENYKNFSIKKGG